MACFWQLGASLSAAAARCGVRPDEVDGRTAGEGSAPMAAACARVPGDSLPRFFDPLLIEYNIPSQDLGFRVWGLLLFKFLNYFKVLKF